MLWWVFTALILAWLMGLVMSVTPLVNLLLLAAVAVLVAQVLRERRIL